MKYKTVKTLEEWSKVRAMGDFERKFKNGELWWFNSELYYLSHLELSPEVLREVVSFYEGPVSI